MSVTATLPLSTPVQETGFSPDSRPVRRQIPSQRNRDIFEAVTQGMSHAAAAEKFGVTQPRVTQIMAQVREWIYQTSPEVREGASECGLLRLAEYTLRIQLDGWMRVAIGNYRETLKTTFMSQACQMAMNLARLSGVDTSGKTNRAKAEEQAREEAAQRAKAANKPLWENREQSFALTSKAETSAAATPRGTATSVSPRATGPSLFPVAESEKNPYGRAPLGEAGGELRDVPLSVLDRAAPADTGPLPSTLAMSTQNDSPLPKFLDKKTRKRLRAMRRREARTQSLAAVSS